MLEGFGSQSSSQSPFSMIIIRKKDIDPFSFSGPFSMRTKTQMQACNLLPRTSILHNIYARICCDSIDKAYNAN